MRFSTFQFLLSELARLKKLTIGLSVEFPRRLGGRRRRRKMVEELIEGLERVIDVLNREADEELRRVKANAANKKRSLAEGQIFPPVR